MELLRIEGDSDELMSLHQFIFDHNNELEVKQILKTSAGGQNEPTITSLIMSLTPIVSLLIKQYFDYRKIKLKAETKLKLSIKKDGVETSTTVDKI